MSSDGVVARVDLVSDWDDEWSTYWNPFGEGRDSEVKEESFCSIIIVEHP